MVICIFILSCTGHYAQGFPKSERSHTIYCRKNMLLFFPTARCPFWARILLCLRPEGAINLISTLQNKKPNGTKKRAEGG